MNPRWNSHQAFVDEMVERCLEYGTRSRWDMIQSIRSERISCSLSPVWSGLDGMDVKDKTLIHKISLTTSREDKNGHRPIWCVPGRHRYLSVQRVKALAAKVDALTITPLEIAELRESVKDLQLLQDYWASKAKKAFQRVSQLEQLQIHATVAVLDLT